MVENMILEKQNGCQSAIFDLNPILSEHEIKVGQKLNNFGAASDYPIILSAIVNTMFTGDLSLHAVFDSFSYFTRPAHESLTSTCQIMLFSYIMYIYYLINV